ncbi:hypothetical protein VPH35_003486 [Triticum aestivum]
MQIWHRPGRALPTVQAFQEGRGEAVEVEHGDGIPPPVAPPGVGVGLLVRAGHVHAVPPHPVHPVRLHAEAADVVHEHGAVAEPAAADLRPPGRQAPAVRAKGLEEALRAVASSVHDEEELGSGRHDERGLAHPRAVGHHQIWRLDRGDHGEGRAVHGRYLVGALVEDVESAVAVGDAADASWRREVGGGPRPAVALQPAEERALTLRDHDGVRRPVPDHVTEDHLIPVVEGWRQRGQALRRAREGVQQRGREVVGHGERPAARRGEEEGAAARCGHGDLRDAVVGEGPETAVDAGVLLGGQEEQGHAAAGGVLRRGRAPRRAHRAEAREVRMLGDPVGDPGYELGWQVGPAHGVRVCVFLD